MILIDSLFDENELVALTMCDVQQIKIKMKKRIPVSYMQIIDFFHEN